MTVEEFDKGYREKVLKKVDREALFEDRSKFSWACRKEKCTLEQVKQWLCST